MKKHFLCNFIEITLCWHGCSAVNFLCIFRTLFLKKTSGRLLLSASTFTVIMVPSCYIRLEKKLKTNERGKYCWISIKSNISSVGATTQSHHIIPWLHKTILRLSHLFQISWAFALFYKSIFKTTFSFLFNITLKTYPSSVST